MGYVFCLHSAQYQLPRSTTSRTAWLSASAFRLFSKMEWTTWTKGPVSEPFPQTASSPLWCEKNKSAVFRLPLPARESIAAGGSRFPLELGGQLRKQIVRGFQERKTPIAGGGWNVWVGTYKTQSITRHRNTRCKPIHDVLRETRTKNLLYPRDLI